MKKTPEYIEFLPIDPTIDFVFHKLFGKPKQKPLLLDLVNSVLELEGAAQINDLEIINPINDVDFENNKLGVVDIKARDDDGNIFQMEIQTTIPGDLAPRMTYYLGSITSTQLLKGESYTNLRKVNAIWFLTKNMWPKSVTSSSRLKFVMHCHEEGITLNEHQAIYVIQLKNEACDVKLKLRLRLWIRFFVEATDWDLNNLPKWVLEDKIMLKAANVLKDINLDQDTFLAYIDRRMHYLATTGMENHAKELRQQLEQRVQQLEQQGQQLEQQGQQLEQQGQQLLEKDRIIEELRAKLDKP